MPQPKPTQPRLMNISDRPKYTGAFSFNRDILRYHIELAIPGYRSNDPATWPFISGGTISRSTGRKYDGSMGLPGGTAVFDIVTMTAFLGNIARKWSFDTKLQAGSLQKPGATIRRGFRDFPFVFAQSGQRKNISRWDQLPYTMRDHYMQLVGPGQPASSNNVQSSSVAQNFAVASSN